MMGTIQLGKSNYRVITSKITAVHVGTVKTTAISG